MNVDNEKVLCEIIHEVFGDDQKEYADYVAKEYKHFSRKDFILFIAQSPNSLEKKYEWFKRLADAYPIPGDDRLDHPGKISEEYSFQRYRELVKKAIDELSLKENEYFVFETWCFENNEPRMYGYKIASDFNDVNMFIFDEYDDGEMTELDPSHILDQQKKYCCWTRIQKYTKGSDGKFKATYYYYLLGTEICWFMNREGFAFLRNDDYIFYKKLTDRFDRFAFCLQLVPCFAIPSPYKPGDIVEVDSRPFAPVRHVVILNNREDDSCDCCVPWALFVDYNGSLETGAFNHNYMIRDFVDEAIPAVFNSRLITDKSELKNDEEFLWSIGNYINGSEKKGRIVGDYFNNKDFVSAESLMKDLRIMPFVSD